MPPIEPLYQGCATWLDTGAGAEIRIPARRNWLVLGFLLLWLGGWLVGELAVLGIVTGTALTAFGGDHLAAGAPGLFLLVWLLGWTVGGVFVIRTVWWLLRGYEQVSLENGILTLAKPNLLFHKAKAYDLAEVRHVRVQEDPAVAYSFYYGRRTLLGGNNGPIRFDYGLKTIKFGAGLDEAEARFLVERLRQRLLLKERNFG